MMSSCLYRRYGRGETQTLEKIGLWSCNKAIGLRTLEPMCAEFLIRASNQKIRRALGVPARGDRDESEDFEIHARLFMPLPAVAAEFAIRMMSFSLKPPGTSYPTFNARLLSWDDRAGRIVSIGEKPTWREPLKTHRCVVPMNGFIEPVYKGDHAGEMVLFKETSDNILFCAGVYEEGVDKKTGEVYEGFALILHTPSEFVRAVGHHRQPIFLKPEAAREWIDRQPASPKAVVDFLLANRYLPELAAETSRKMARGWEKRIADSERKFENEMEFMKQLESARS